MALFPSLFGLVIFYPLISIGVNYILGNSKISLESIWQEYYLWGGFSLVFIGLYFILFLGSRTVLPVWLVFTVYTIGYFGISIFRKMVWNESKDLFEKKQANA